MYQIIGNLERKQVDEDAYDEAVADSLEIFQNLILAYLAGRITISVLRGEFTDALELHLTRLMLLGLDGKDPTERDIEQLNTTLAARTVLLGGFLTGLSEDTITPNRAVWRAGLYATDREAFIYYTVPEAVVSLMPGLPGEICLGNGLCGCHLDVQFSDSGASVFWIVDPIKESCEVCLGMQDRSPFIFSNEQIANG